MRCTLLGIGAMASPRYRPAGLLVTHGRWRVVLDGGPGAEVQARLDAWLVCDASSELQPALRRLAASHDRAPEVAEFERPGFTLAPLPVEHSNHPTFGYLIGAGRLRVVWAPEFLTFPEWARKADLMFAEAAGWGRPIRFARGAGGHAGALEVSQWAREARVRRLVFAHIGRPTIGAIEAGQRPPFGEFGVEGRTYQVRRRRPTS